MAKPSTPVKIFGTSVEFQLVPLNEVEIALAANFASQLLVALGSAMLPSTYSFMQGSQSITLGLWPFGVFLLVVGVAAYGFFVLRKYRDWKKRRAPLKTLQQSTASNGILVEFTGTDSSGTT